jgi:hypothetical protein
MSSINDRINILVNNFFDGNNSKFAELLNTSEANIRNYRSKTEPKIDVLVQISEKLEINYEWLLTGHGAMLKGSAKSVNQSIVGQNIDSNFSGKISNVNGSGININGTSELIGVIKGQQELIKKQQEQISSLIEVINKLSSK